MPTKRCSCAAVYTNPALIVAGGINDDINLTAVEILNIFDKQWSSVSPLPFPTKWPSVSISGGYLYIHVFNAPPNSIYSLTRCSLVSLAFSSESTPKYFVWEKIASLPVNRSTLVTIKGHLLAVGGEFDKGEFSNNIYQFNPTTDSWQVISTMNTARSACAVALLPDNKLVVVGGTGKEEPIELAKVTIL